MFVCKCFHSHLHFFTFTFTDSPKLSDFDHNLFDSLNWGRICIHFVLDTNTENMKPIFEGTKEQKYTNFFRADNRAKKNISTNEWTNRRIVHIVHPICHPFENYPKYIYETISKNERTSVRALHSSFHLDHLRFVRSPFIQTITKWYKTKRRQDEN